MASQKIVEAKATVVDEITLHSYYLIIVVLQLKKLLNLEKYFVKAIQSTKFGKIL